MNSRLLWSHFLGAITQAAFGTRARSGKPKWSLRIKQIRIGGQASQFLNAMDGALNYKAAMVEQKRAQAGKFFAPTRPSGAAVQAAGDHVAVARMLGADRRIHSQDSSVKVPDAQNNFLQECWIVRKNGRDQRATATANHWSEILQAAIANESHDWAEDFDVVNMFGCKPIIAGEKCGLNKRGLLRIGVQRFEIIVSPE